MASLGTFGKQHDPVDLANRDTFDWFGATITVSAELNEIELIDFMDSARGIESNDFAAVGALKDAFRMLIDPADFDAFWAGAKKNRQSVEDLSEVFQVLLEGAVARPTQRRSDSSAGPPATGASSPAALVSSASSGRPDLQVIHDDSAATRARATGSGESSTGTSKAGKASSLTRTFGRSWRRPG